MASYFNADYYFAAKAKQLSNIPGGKTYTAAEVKAEFAQLGVNPEEHYNAFGSAEGLNPNPYFNEKEYLETKLKSLQENAATKAEWTGKSAADLKATFSAAGLTAAEHYEKAGAFETRADGTLLNPSNAFDANAYFAAKLAQLQKAGFDGADTMTVADVVKAVQSAGISPVSHLQTAGAAEAKADGIALVQTVPVAQRMSNDTNRAATGELVPGNYNQPTKGPAAATAAPVTKPADVGGLSADAPVAPTEAVKTPADTGFVAPPAGLVDGPNSVVIPPSGHTGTGPNASFVVVDKTTGKGDVIKLDGTKQGTIDKVEFDSTGNPVKPPVDVVIKDESGKNTNDKPADDNDEPVPPQPDPTPDPDPVDPPAPVPATLKVVYPEDTTANLSLSKAANVAVTVGEDASGDAILELTPENNGTKIALKTGVTKVGIESNTTLTGKSDVLDGIALTGAGHLKLTEAAVTKDLTIKASGLSGNVTAIFKEGAETARADAKTLTYSGASGVDNLTLKAEGTSGNFSNLKLLADLGAGNDVINLELGQKGISFATGSTLSGGAGTDTLKITGTATGNGVLKFHDDSSLVDIEKIDLSAVAVGNHSIGINLSNQTEGFAEVKGSSGGDYLAGGSGVDTIYGDAGADWIKGGAGADTIYASVSGDSTSATLAMNTWAAESLGGVRSGVAWSTSGSDTANGTVGSGDLWMTSGACGVIDKANIIEGGVGDDTMYASASKDVFLYQVGGVTHFGNEPGFNGITTNGDTIHNFTYGTDKLMIMDQDAWNNHATEAVTDGNPNTFGQRGFSTLWKFEDDNKLTINGASATNNKVLSWGSGADADVKIVKTEVDGVDGKFDYTITISDDVLAKEVSGTAQTMVIKLVGLADNLFDTADELNKLFGSDTVTV